MPRWKRSPAPGTAARNALISETITCPVSRYMAATACGVMTRVLHLRGNRVSREHVTSPQIRHSLLPGMIDLYCERLGPGLWAEPVNAATNLAFLLAAWGAWRLAAMRSVLCGEIWLLLALIVSIAIGSGLFHTLATTWSHVLDVVPILLFQLLFVWVYCRRVIGMPMAYAAAIILVYLLAALWARQFPHLLNNSLAYAPAFVVLFALGAYHFLTQRTGRAILIAGAGVFLAALVCRTIDAAACAFFPLGTHFLWHIFNAVLIYLLMRGLLVNLRRE